MSKSLNPKRTVAELKELRALTSDDNGAQRVAFTGEGAKFLEFGDGAFGIQQLSHASNHGEPFEKFNTCNAWRDVASVMDGNTAGKAN